MYKAKFVMTKPRRSSRDEAEAEDNENQCSHCSALAKLQDDYDISYRYVNQPSLKSTSIVVGGRRVPYFEHQRAKLREAHEFSKCLSPIREDAIDCEQCHSKFFSIEPNTKHVTLHRSRGTSRLHHDLGVQVH
ncbi:unnamed protein product [Aphanomyces euteiches]|uniref:C2H2-type domain-containing protein n=1 Tax=Aphanomyces euteiches TaxID=100861 RepID=A0A6G0WQK5_9STRA|nr:hypothetical protein Ae201684_012743 [Aphanomyces euteiches]KAH9095687.1 hypothetical protein Ae201684P_015486 [Aphanomyces euteiches]KAH9141413.1 hypothetical protein AeRB84_014403 [Aphanomyces euteiches]